MNSALFDINNNIQINMTYFSIYVVMNFALLNTCKLSILCLVFTLHLKVCAKFLKSVLLYALNCLSLCVCIKNMPCVIVM